MRAGHFFIVLLASDLEQVNGWELGQGGQVQVKLPVAEGRPHPFRGCYSTAGASTGGAAALGPADCPLVMAPLVPTEGLAGWEALVADGTLVGLGARGPSGGGGGCGYGGGGFVVIAGEFSVACLVAAESLV